MSYRELYFFRHAETELNRKRIVQGSGVDAPINNYGKKQVAAFHEQYGHLPFEVVLTSTLQRTHQSVAPFLEKGIPWVQLPEIDEMSWGIYEGKKSTPQMKDDYRRMLNAWQRGHLQAKIEGGESAADLEARLRIFISHLENRPERHLLICSHGRAMRGLMCLLDGQPITAMNEYGHSNTGLYHIRYQEKEGYQFVLRNDTSHLAALTPEVK